jgi:protein phosphatase PTC7
MFKWIADGVGGWRETGVDPGDYSRSLMRVACDFFEDRISRPSSSDTKQLEELAREAISVAHQKARMPGSSTICILTISPQQKFVSAANLGDSGFAVIRNGTVVFQTPPLQHFFDCPLQLGCCPDFVDATDFPSDALTYSLNVTPGDVIVMGSDGLWDNCRMDEIVQLLPDKDDEVYKSAEMLAAVAREHAGVLSSHGSHDMAPVLYSSMWPVRPIACSVS